jgi:hypothetical protein
MTSALVKGFLTGIEVLLSVQVILSHVVMPVTLGGDRFRHIGGAHRNCGAPLPICQGGPT